MEPSAITATEATANTLIDQAYALPDYRDAYLVGSNAELEIEDFATAFFLSQPTWLARVSMNVGGRQSRIDAIGDGSYEAGGSVGSWKIHGRADNEIMFGEHMGFMEYRFSLLKRPDGRIEAGTSVRYLKRLGNVYFAVVKPFHIGFIKVALRHAAAGAIAASQTNLDLAARS